MTSAPPSKRKTSAASSTAASRTGPVPRNQPSTLRSLDLSRRKHRNPTMRPPSLSRPKYRNLTLRSPSLSRCTGRNHRRAGRKKVYPDFLHVTKNQDRLSPVLKSDSSRSTSVLYCALLLSDCGNRLYPCVAHPFLNPVGISSLVHPITTPFPFHLRSPLHTPLTTSASRLTHPCCFLHQSIGNPSPVLFTELIAAAFVIFFLTASYIVPFTASFTVLLMSPLSSRRSDPLCEMLATDRPSAAVWSGQSRQLCPTEPWLAKNPHSTVLYRGRSRQRFANFLCISSPFPVLLMYPLSSRRSDPLCEMLATNRPSTAVWRGRSRQLCPTEPWLAKNPHSTALYGGVPASVSQTFFA